MRLRRRNRAYRVHVNCNPRLPGRRVEPALEFGPRVHVRSDLLRLTLLAKVGKPSARGHIAASLAYAQERPVGTVDYNTAVAEGSQSLRLHS